MRDKDRVYRALDGIDYVIHAAAIKIVPTAEYNPFETVKTNIIGGMNVIDAAIDKKLKKHYQQIKHVILLIFMSNKISLKINFSFRVIHIQEKVEQDYRL